MHTKVKDPFLCERLKFVNKVTNQVLTFLGLNENEKKKKKKKNMVKP